MARVAGTTGTACESFIVYFVIFLGITTVSAYHDDQWYDNSGNNQSPPHIVLLDSDSAREDIVRVKRVAPEASSVAPKHDVSPTDEVPLPPPKKFQPSQQHPYMTSPSLATVPVSPLPSSQKPGLLQTNAPRIQTPKNVGVNGSGQYKYYPDSSSTPIPPPSLSSPIPLLRDGKDEGRRNDRFSDSLENVDLSEKSINETLSKHNITKNIRDNHLYYNSTISTDPDLGKYYWVDLANRSDAKTNELLSSSHRRAATIKLSFDFPFYGHLIKNVTVATGGFLYTGEYVHSWLAATQYIAPLMANFDTSLSNESFVKYLDNGTAFIVEWERVSLQDKPNGGEFTFEVILKKNGDIVFVYKDVPEMIENIQDDQHPVKIGLSDAYIMDKTIFFLRRKTIYEYHRVNFGKQDIKNWTSIYLKALPTCLDYQDCDSCLNAKISNMECLWCPAMNICSNGFDRHRQQWLMKRCGERNISNPDMCSRAVAYDDRDNFYSHDANTLHDTKFSRLDQQVVHRMTDQSADHVGVSGVVAILFLISMVFGLTFWVYYAYRNPHTTSGQILIRYRPSQWRWRRGEARYTAATIHM